MMGSREGNVSFLWPLSSDVWVKSFRMAHVKKKKNKGKKMKAAVKFSPVPDIISEQLVPPGEIMRKLCCLSELLLQKKINSAANMQNNQQQQKHLDIINNAERLSARRGTTVMLITLAERLHTHTQNE